MKIEVWTDIMCPYCYIGKVHYEKALRSFKHADEVELEWKAFQLNNELPGNGQGYPVTDYLKRAMGLSEDEMEQMFQRIEALADEAGIPCNLRHAVAANTRDAHRLIKLAAKKGLDSNVLLMLSKAYFEEAKDYSDHELLVQIGKNVGLNEEEIRSMLTGDDFISEIEQDMQEAVLLGIDTVPTFLFERRHAIIGSESTDVFIETLNKAYEEWKSSSAQTEISTRKGRSCSADGVCEL